MTANIRFVICAAILVGAALLTAVVSYVSAANYGNSAENGIVAQWEDNENILSQYTNSIGEMAQVPAMQRDDLKEVYTEAMTGRYGEDGSKAVFQWLQEQNPQLNNALYTNLQTAMEAGRKDFADGQRNLIDQKRSYNTALGTVWRGFWLKQAGYPKIKLSDYKAITNTYADGAFEKGVEDGVTLRKD